MRGNQRFKKDNTDPREALFSLSSYSLYSGLILYIMSKAEIGSIDVRMFVIWRIHILVLQVVFLYDPAIVIKYTETRTSLLGFRISSLLSLIKDRSNIPMASSIDNLVFHKKMYHVCHLLSGVSPKIAVRRSLTRETTRETILTTRHIQYTWLLCLKT